MSTNTTTALMLALCLCAAPCCDEPAGKAEPTSGGGGAAAEQAAPKKDDGVLRLGEPLTKAPRVDVEALYAKPEEYKGKRVRVEGVVKDYCHHKRAWFGVTPKGSDLMVRVFVLPGFEAPVGCKGKRVVAEGVVDTIEIPAESVAHYAKEHHFITPEQAASGKPVHQPILRGTGAEFF